jgi:hypothetical protein
MAYQGGGLLQLLKPDLTTRPGAEAAMDSAKFGFLLVAGFRVVIYGFLGLAGGAAALAVGTAAPLIALLVLIDIGVPLLAAWRLHIYKGAFAVPIATALYVLGILAAPAPGSIVIGLIFTVVFIGGIRGAWAIRRGTGFEDDYYATFN